MNRRFAKWVRDDMSLTPAETRLMLILGRRAGEWVAVQELIIWLFEDDDESLFACDRNTVRTTIWRTRQKLRGTPWRIENRYSHGLYRLVEVA